MPILDVLALKGYLRSGYNVLLKGHAGVGKTAIITEIFEGLNWKYFSAPTLDPWVDLIGVPKPVEDKKYGGYVLEYIRPPWVKEAQVEAIFIDELNRASAKTLDALLELILFRRINGVELPNLKVIWAAINPEDDNDYTTTLLDRAMIDRFHVQIDVPYALDESYFKRKYPGFAEPLMLWWKDLPSDVQQRVSPRRLDFIGHAFQEGHQLKDFLPPDANTGKLMQALRSRPFATTLAEIKTSAQATKFLAEVNNSTKLLQLVKAKDSQAIEFFEKYKTSMPQELIEAFIPSVKAAVSGAKITTLAELLPSLAKLTIGSGELTAAVNDVALLYENSHSLQDEVKHQIRVGTAGFKRLSSHIIKIFGAGSEVVMRHAAFEIDPQDASKKRRTNLMNIAVYIAQLDTSFAVFSKEDRKKINAHTFRLGLAGAKWM
jgi:hypothetical protein